MAIPGWEGDWSGDLAVAAKMLGFSGLVKYAESRASMTYYQLAEELGKAAGRTFAPVQIEHALRDSANDARQLALFARVSLVRHLRHLMPNGWSKDDVFPFSHAIGAWASWLPKKYHKRCFAFGKILMASTVSEGWLPNDCSDEVLVPAFEKAGFR